MRLNRNKIALACLMLMSAIPMPAFAETLEEAVWNMLNPTTFSLTALDEQCMVLVETGSNRRFYTRSDIEAYLGSAKSGGTKFEAKDFKVLNKDELNQFASITYQVTWTSSTGNTTTVTHLTSKEIWERVPSGWRRVFAAMNQ